MSKENGFGHGHLSLDIWPFLKADKHLCEGKMDYSSKVREFVVENFLFGDGESLQEDTSFMEEGIIDSTGILELVFFQNHGFEFSQRF